MKHYTINKFGGSSLATADCFLRVTEILKKSEQVTVVSAVGGVTNALQNLLDTAASNNAYQSQLAAVITRHENIITKLVLENTNVLKQMLKVDAAALADILHTVSLTQSYSPQIQDLVISYGEIWSAQILTALLNKQYQAEYLDASKLIFVRHKQNIIEVDWGKSEAALQQFIQQHSFNQLVITGFIAADEENKRITLGRNGSDFSAAIVATLFKGSDLYIWTDVDGIYSADPRRVPKAFILEQISYQEILELSYFGAEVLHPQAIAPAIANNITIHIKNTFNTQALGTVITVESDANQYLVRGVSSIDDIALINVAGPGLVGVSGIAARLFKALSEANISIILISQASSEHSICIAVRSNDVHTATQVVNHQFYLEMNAGLMDALTIDNDCAVLAAVGEGMVGTPGITARLGHALAQSNISIKALAQGSSERNISAVIARSEINKALRALHSGFYLSGKTVSIGVIGPGLIGNELLTQIESAKQKLQQEYNVNLYVRGIMNSKKMLLAKEYINLKNWQTEFKDIQVTSNFEIFAQHIIADDIPHAVIIDCSASEIVANHYLEFLQQGISIITPNKKANSGDFDYYQQLIDSTKGSSHYYLYETTVCAGLPVIKTLQDMIRSGDEVMRIEGIVSGTLAYIFNQLETETPFSTIVKEAKEKGFTEPDPRDDLAGMDVARKMVVLARELGLEVSLDDVQVHNLVPEALRNCSREEFLEKLPTYDAVIRQELEQLVKADERACYVGVIEKNGSIAVKIAGYPTTHPFSHLNGTDNILAFYTRRYQQQPLVVQGPGAGAEVTAAGVFADLLRLVSFLE